MCSRLFAVLDCSQFSWERMCESVCLCVCWWWWCWCCSQFVQINNASLQSLSTYKSRYRQSSACLFTMLKLATRFLACFLLLTWSFLVLQKHLNTFSLNSVSHKRPTYNVCVQTCFSSPGRVELSVKRVQINAGRWNLLESRNKCVFFYLVDSCCLFPKKLFTKIFLQKTKYVRTVVTNQTHACGFCTKLHRSGVFYLNTKGQRGHSWCFCEMHAVNLCKK